MLCARQRAQPSKSALTYSRRGAEKHLRPFGGEKVHWTFSWFRLTSQRERGFRIAQEQHCLVHDKHLVFVHKSYNFTGQHRRAEVVALDRIASLLAQKFQLFTRLQTLGDHLQP